jgi:hypothetical protein
MKSNMHVKKHEDVPDIPDTHERHYLTKRESEVTEMMEST